MEKIRRPDKSALIIGGRPGVIDVVGVNTIKDCAAVGVKQNPPLPGIAILRFVQIGTVSVNTVEIAGANRCRPVDCGIFILVVRSPPQAAAGEICIPGPAEHGVKIGFGNIPERRVSRDQIGP